MLAYDEAAGSGHQHALANPSKSLKLAAQNLHYWREIPYSLSLGSKAVWVLLFLCNTKQMSKFKPALI